MTTNTQKKEKMKPLSVVVGKGKDREGYATTASGVCPICFCSLNSLDEAIKHMDKHDAKITV